MKHRVGQSRHPAILLVMAAVLFVAAHCLGAQTMTAPGLTVLPQSYGPYSGNFLQGGIGLTKPLAATDPVLKADAPWTMSAWVEFSPVPTGPMLIAGAGDPSDEDSRFFAVENGLPELRFGEVISFDQQALSTHPGGICWRPPLMEK